MNKGLVIKQISGLNYLLNSKKILYNTIMKAFTQSFFEGLGIQVDSLTITEEGDDISINIETPDSSLLIGQHGKNIEVFKHLLWRVAEKKLGKFIHLHFEVNDYMKSKDERLFRFLESKIAFVMSTGKSIRIPNLSSFERKKAHNYIFEKKVEWLSTKSEGEWEERALMLIYTGPLVAQSEPKKESSSKSDIDSLSLEGVGI
jgi:predicted RNA-binding protein Jag